MTDTTAVTALLHRYADAADRRDWPAFDGVFAEDVRVEHEGTVIASGRPALLAMVRGFLDDCGPTQHLIGNEQVVVDGDHATLTAKMRAHHTGVDRPDLTLEMFGWYHVRAERTADGWRITDWQWEVSHEAGTREVFGHRP